ncbi:fructose-bisphosphate aldolase [Hydrogenispora ethanolica]|uniref:Fructose-bisphosphate aldolase n=1 Tax=Hydrogenispora ethanolica TaxID=1082276 RepID=A0A4R1SAA1_HYDET|nr:tagatose-bisphosphate aldolase subunit GatY [Hydrogenispora ethanolica]TCL76279.1 fructose-bisphosphate aldolase [Hydrogenispora ethanolica]
MALVNPLAMIEAARRKGAAVAAFNVHNLETVQAVVEAAAAERAPVMLQTTPGTLKHAGIPYIAAIAKVAAELHRIPVALHVDHCGSFGTIVQCIQYGYTSVMIDGSHYPYPENVALVQRVVEIAKAAGVAVEAELGRIGGTEDQVTVAEREATFTVPEEARDFAAATGINTLAIAIGTAHGEYHGEPRIDFERLTAIRSLVDIPLVLHGASGVPDESVRQAIRRGIAKVNIATELKIPMAQAIQASFAQNPRENDPRNYLGAAKEAVKRVVREKIRLCGASGLADELR